MNVLIIGNLTIDENVTESGTYKGVGGSAFFAGKTLSGFNSEVTVVSPRGKDFDDGQLKGISLYPSKPTKSSTLTFQNVNTKAGRRQMVKHASMAGHFQALDIPGQLYDAVMVAPLVANMDTPFLLSVKEKFPCALRILLPQGLFRTVTKDGRVKRKEWKDVQKVIADYKIIVFSREDVGNADRVASEWSQKDSLVVVTKDREGCTVYGQGKVSNIPAVPVSAIVDSTGAGDIFAAAFTYDYFKNANPINAARFANSVASQSLRLLPNQLDLLGV